MDPIILSAIISGIASMGSAALSGGGEEIGMTGTDPEMDENRRRLMALAMSRIGQNRPYAQVNPMNMMGANMASQYYYGQPYTHPGYGMGSSFAGLTGDQIEQAGKWGWTGPGGSPGSRPPAGPGSGGLPIGGIPGAPGQRMPPGAPVPGMQYGRPGQLSKGANFAR